jgi:WD40 repeat protein
MCNRKRLAWIDQATTVHLSAVETGKELGTLDAKSDHLAFSPDSKALATICRDGTVLLWEVTEVGK